MDDSPVIICPPDQHGICAKEQKNPLDMDEELICFYRKKEFRNGALNGPFLLNPENLGGSADPKKQGWSFARKKDITSDHHMRQVAQEARRGKPDAAGYAAATVAQIKQAAAHRIQKPEALGVIHDGSTYPEHVNVENCIALSEDDVQKLRNFLLAAMSDNTQNCRPPSRRQAPISAPINVCRRDARAPDKPPPPPQSPTTYRRKPRHPLNQTTNPWSACVSLALYIPPTAQIKIRLTAPPLKMQARRPRSKQTTAPATVANHLLATTKATNPPKPPNPPGSGNAPALPSSPIRYSPHPSS